MTLDGFLTFISLLIAVYALASPVAKLRARLVFVVQIPLALVTLLSVLYLEFFEVVGLPCPSVLHGICDCLVFPADGSITPSDVAFLVVLAWIGLVIVVQKYLFRPLATLSLSTMARLVDRLAYEKRFAELLEFVEPYLPTIDKASRRKLRLQKLHDRLEAMRGGITSIRFSLPDREQTVETGPQSSPSFKKLQSLIGRLSVAVPKQHRTAIVADEIAWVLFQTEDLLFYIAKNRPYFALSLLQQEMYMYSKRQFVETYLSFLIGNTGSVLYQELQNNQHTTFQSGYELLERNRLLYFLFSDANVAKDLEVWRPVGNRLLKSLRQESQSDFITYLNGSAVDFDSEYWEDQVYVGVAFFDLMVTTAAHQGVDWHMWLYYTTYMTEQLELIYDSSDSSVNTSDEFPTRSAHLVYDIVYVLCNWVNLAANLPEDSPHVAPLKLDQDRIRKWSISSYPNNNIPASAAIALGTSLHTIVMSNRFERHFVANMYVVVLRTVRDLNSDGNEGYLRFFLIHSIIYGGQKSYSNEYGERLYSYLSEIDPILLYEIEDFKRRLQEVYPGLEE